MQYIQQVEQALLQDEGTVPVYFAEESPELLEIERQVKSAVNSDQAASAAEGKMLLYLIGFYLWLLTAALNFASWFVSTPKG